MEKKTHLQPQQKLSQFGNVGNHKPQKKKIIEVNWSLNLFLTFCKPQPQNTLFRIRDEG